MYGIAKGGAQRRQPVHTGIAVNNFNFNFHLLNSVVSNFLCGDRYPLFRYDGKKGIQNNANFGSRVYFLRRCPNWRQLKDKQDTTRTLKTLWDMSILCCIFHIIMKGHARALNNGNKTWRQVKRYDNANYNAIFRIGAFDECIALKGVKRIWGYVVRLRGWTFSSPQTTHGCMFT
jgi:hypothetical protein